jgi:hypothetical protein
VTGDLERVVAMAQLMVRAAEHVAALTEQLRLAKEVYTRLETEDLPQLMHELQLKEFVLEDGSRLELKPDVQCGISEARRVEAHAWLVANGYGGLIKSEVTVQFEREKVEEARQLAEEIGGIVSESVHPATLKAFVKERIQAGTPIPAETFGIFPFDRVTYTKPKAPKKSKS